MRGLEEIKASNRNPRKHAIEQMTDSERADNGIGLNTPKRREGGKPKAKRDVMAEARAS